MIADCHRFYFAQDGDGCWAIANSAGIDLKYVIPEEPFIESKLTRLAVTSTPGTLRLGLTVVGCGSVITIVLVFLGL